LREHGVDLDRASEARGQLEGAGAYLELHIEQGPVLESMELPLGVVLGTFGVERSRITWRGQAAHSGSTPMGGTPVGGAIRIRKLIEKGN
jgi:N-carbamoyl-L-amino-acid hydrolase